MCTDVNLHILYVSTVGLEKYSCANKAKCTVMYVESKVHCAVNMVLGLFSHSYHLM